MTQNFSTLWNKFNFAARKWVSDSNLAMKYRSKICWNSSWLIIYVHIHFVVLCNFQSTSCLFLIWIALAVKKRGLRVKTDFLSTSFGKSFVERNSQMEKSFLAKKKVFCFKNYSDQLWKIIVWVIVKIFENSRLKTKNLYNF